MGPPSPGGCYQHEQDNRGEPRAQGDSTAPSTAEMSWFEGCPNHNRGSDPRGMNADREDDTHRGAQGSCLPQAVCTPRRALGQAAGSTAGLLSRWTSLREMEMNERAPGTFPTDDGRGPGAPWMLMCGWEEK